MTIQLEFNLKNTSKDDEKLLQMQAQIDAIGESNGKVRRKLFSQMGELQKLCLSIKQENDFLREKLKEISNDKTEWIYREGHYLFDVREYQAIGA